MSKLHLSPELALGYAELKFFQDALNDQHKDLIKAEMLTSGVIQKNSEYTPEEYQQRTTEEEDDGIDSLFTSFKVIQGAGPAITVQAGSAIDSFGNIMIQGSDKNNLFVLEDEPGSKTVILTYEETYIEKGYASIQPDGVVTLAASRTTDENLTYGFEDRLRGKAQFPSIISFPNSTVNTGEYLVQTVISQTQLVLNVGEGVLQDDPDQEWAIVGTFTPGVIIPDEDKFPFRVGVPTITLSETNYGLSTNQDLDVEFPGVIFLAIVRYNEGVLTILDKRGLNLYKKSPYIH